jgi:hypothetical protein
MSQFAQLSKVEKWLAKHEQQQELQEVVEVDGGASNREQPHPLIEEARAYRDELIATCEGIRENNGRFEVPPVNQPDWLAYYDILTVSE